MAAAGSPCPGGGVLWRNRFGTQCTGPEGGPDDECQGPIAGGPCQAVDPSDLGSLVHNLYQNTLGGFNSLVILDIEGVLRLAAKLGEDVKPRNRRAEVEGEHSLIDPSAVKDHNPMPG